LFIVKCFQLFIFYGTLIFSTLTTCVADNNNNCTRQNGIVLVVLLLCL